MDQPAGEAYQPAGQPQIRAGSSPADMSFTITTTGAGGGRGGRGGGRGAAATDSAATDSASANDPYGRMQPISRPPYNAITHPENPARYDGRHIVDMLYKANGQPQFIAGRRTPPPADTARAAQIYLERPGSPRVELTKTNYSHRDATRVARRQVGRVPRRREAPVGLCRESRDRFGREAGARPQARRSAAQRHRDLHPSRRGLRSIRPPSARRTRSSTRATRRRSRGRRQQAASRSSAIRAATRISGCSS